MSVIINARSPYYIKQSADSGKTLSSVTLELFIYSGEKGTAKPLTPTYTIVKTPLSSTADNYVVFEVSEFIRDYLYIEYYNESQDAVWVEADIDYTHTDTTTGTNDLDYLAFDGYGYFEEGAQPRTSTDPTDTSYTPMVLQDCTTIFFVRGRDIRIPVFSEPEPTVTTDIEYGVWDLETDYWEESLPEWQSSSTPLYVDDSDNSEQKIQYIIISTDQAVDGEQITITSRTGTSQTVVLTIKEICEPKFEKYRAVFSNKYGVLQTLWLTKKSSITTNTKSEQYKSTIIDYATQSVSYDITKHVKKKFGLNANQSISLNTEFLNECMNNHVEQLMMSEQVWIEDGNNEALPAFLNTNSLKRKTSVNDRLIQYTLDFDYAFDKINNIR